MEQTETPRTVLKPNDIVPFFINVVNDSQRLYEIVQVPLNEANPTQIANNLVEDFGISRGFIEPILSLVETQYDDFNKVSTQIPTTEWAINGSAVHILTIEVGIDAVVYGDMIEWDIFDESADPDEFARQTVKELALPVEFSNVISAQIRWQVIRLRAMHCYPERFQQYIQENRIAAPQVQKGLRSGSDLLDASPVVGLVPGVTEKKAISSRDRHARHLKRQGHTVSRGALQPDEDKGVIPVKLVPVVRGMPMPEDSPSINLAAVPSMLNDDAYDSPDLVEKVARKFNSPLLLSHAHGLNDSGSDSGSD
ncbi:SWI/SNF-related matrix-associated actin-dependent regulator of chromatin subfamily B member 1 [Histomonas meleagridis]|uniref:SWI/SNF-related matrix-associated actin-dependent regulator of chromatin subfamily B member 1 n=1 Tax=Histomonas meleagridis TaxID=135588 RepID=UPI00355983D9|nr:SWI/SNF-related matrix-associated actin-dependent regulator of chromatin subfamily B member 1 [Histomonas meleagridis]KAH0797984.1 SWI/SNF-related matrix-associated actin-dependent regulator of chromatin subfamily B member 1 [Histomonas meleagridis]